MAATILAGDVGGTKIHLGLYSAADGALTRLADHVYATRDFPNLEAVLGAFLGPAQRVAAACCGVPGPVLDGVARPVNIPWEIRASALTAALHGAPVRLLNDLEATAWGTLRLPADATAVLQAGQAPQAPANVVVIAAGTGLGEAGIVRIHDGWHVVACEGGHTDFGPRGTTQEALLHFLAREFEHVSYERLLAGPGLHNIYRFVVAQGAAPEPGWLIARLAREDPAAVIGEVGVAGEEPNTARTLELFSAIYGAEAANLALKYLAVGGVYVCGGIAPKLLPALQRGGFMEAFCAKGRMRAMLERIPVRVSLSQDVGLLGAAHSAAAML